MDLVYEISVPKDEKDLLRHLVIVVLKKKSIISWLET